MFRSWRFRLREVDNAFRQGRLELAARMIGEGDLQQYQPGRKLAAKIAESLVEKARGQAASGDIAASWEMLETSRSLGIKTETFLAARAELIRRELADVEYELQADNVAEAQTRLRLLEKRGIVATEARDLREVCQRLQSATQLARAAKFNEADEQLSKVAKLMPHLQSVAQRRSAVDELRDQCHELTARLHAAMSAEDWEFSLMLADELLELAPDFVVARDARRRAWEGQGRASVLPAMAAAAPPSAPSTTSGCDPLVPAAHSISPTSESSARNRFLMWVDGVGGYLVCLSESVTIGQAAPDSDVDVPIQGDLSHQHARIRREDDAYILEPRGEIRIRGKLVDEPTILADQDELCLGGRVRIKFRKPHPLSATARLDFVSRHRTHPWADAALLLAESCVLGPREQNHVVCRDWSDDVVIFRQDGELHCRAMEPIDVDGRICDGEGRIQTDSRIEGEDFAITLEDV